MMYRHSDIFRFQEGTRSEHPTPEAVVSSAPPQTADNVGDELMVLVDLMPPLPHRSRELRAIAVHTYWHSSGSVVARLRRALAEANRHLVRLNAGAEPGAKCSGSITCAVVVANELFFGQIGAAYAFVWHPDHHLEVFPQRDRLLVPLGGTLPPVIHIGYTNLVLSTTLLLATTPVAEVQAREHWHDILAASTSEAVVDKIVDVMAERGATGSLVFARMLHKSQAPQQPSESLPRSRGWWPFRRQRKAPAPPKAPESAEVTVPTSQERVSSTEPEGLQEQASAPQTAPVEAQPVAQIAVTEPDTSMPLPDFLRRRLEHLEEDQSAQQQAPSKKWHFPEIHIPPPREWFHRERKRAQDRRTTAQRARLRQALRVLLPGKIESKRTQTRPAPEEKSTVMGGLTLGMALLVFIITISVYLQFGDPARGEELLDTAYTLRESAYSQQTSEDWRRLLELSSQILILDPQNNKAASLQQEAEEAIDALENAAILDAKPLLDLGTAPTPRRLLVAAGWVYVLNTATDEVIGLQLDADYVTPLVDAPTPILKRGQTFYGETVNHLVDLAWIRPGGTYPDGAVFIYSDGGTLYIYEPVLGPGSITRQHIQGNLEAGMVTLMGTNHERVYLVQRQENQIFTYDSVNGIYELPRGYFPPGTAPYLQEVLGLGIDGRVYLLMGDGSILTYFEGTEDPSFEVSGLPDPELKPIVVAVDPDPEHGLLYLGDSVHGRIAVLNKRGEFMHQFRLSGEELRELEALAVNESPPVLYLVTANRLYAAPLPDFVAQ